MSDAPFPPSSPAGYTANMTSVSPDARRHDLDALRAIAMLLGIVLHVGLAYMPLPVWPIQDTQQSEGYEVLFMAIHGFRMPLFFLVSGFFTAMLWRKRGLRSLLWHRCRRILFPLLAGLVTIIPATWGAIFWAAASKPTPEQGPLIQAIYEANSIELTEALGHGADVNVLDPELGVSALAHASMRGQTKTVELLLAHGAKVNQRNRDGTTALHGAAFLGRAEVARILLAAGADTTLRSELGQSAPEATKSDWNLTRWIAQDILKIKVEREAIEAGRRKVDALFVEAGATPTEQGPSMSSGKLFGLYTALVYMPLFHHLWFLWYLCWLVALFCLYALFSKQARWSRVARWLVCAPGCWVWILPLSAGLQRVMTQASFGADTATGLIPAPHILSYYAIFFFFGVLYFDADDQQGRLARWWPLQLGLAVFLFLPLGLHWNFEASEPLLAAVAISLYAWTMSFAWIGGFRRLFRRENRVMRYISDSSYWLYLAHLPLVIFMQSFMRTWPMPAWIKFIVVTVVVSGLLLFSYRYFVRYTFVGTFLNGPRNRPAGQS